MARSIGLALVAVVVVGLILFVATRPPVSWPAESRRVVHPAGFSVIAPPGWDHFLTFADGAKADSLRVEPKKAIGNLGSILVTKVAVPVTQDGLTKSGYGAITFQGKSAYSRTTQTGFTREHTRSFLFERDGTWYDLTVRRPEVEPIEVGVWLAYAESFRVETVRTPPPATTLPTTLMAVP